MKRRIYRIENGKSQGPFTTLKVAGLVASQFYYDYSEKLSSPQFASHHRLENSHGKHIPHTHHFGCPSLEMLFEWFPMMTHPKLNKAGFFIMVYEVDAGDILIETETQVVFNLLDAEAVDILTIFDGYNKYLDEYLGLAA
jgi:hypothetical protein